MFLMKNIRLDTMGNLLQMSITSGQDTDSRQFTLAANSHYSKLPDIPDLGLKHKYGLPSIQESSSSISAPEDKVAR